MIYLSELIKEYYATPHDDKTWWCKGTMKPEQGNVIWRSESIKNNREFLGDFNIYIDGTIVLPQVLIDEEATQMLVKFIDDFYKEAFSRWKAKEE